jgi:Tol biopolymer transport system component
VQLTNLRRVCGTPRWSPDGKRISADCSPTADSEIYVIDADGGIPRNVTNSTSDDVVANWSRDGQWIYFASNRSGTFQVWKMSSEGGNAVQLTKGGGFYAVESFDRKVLYFVKPGRQRQDYGTIWKVPLDGGEETPVLEREILWADWALRPEGIYFAASTSTSYTIELYRLQTGKIAHFYQENTPVRHAHLRISPDGRWLLFCGPLARPESDLMMVENFR